jgi:hypothetical protein
MNRFGLIVLTALVAGAATSVHAQSPAQPPTGKATAPVATQKSTINARDSVSIADIQRAANDLVIAVQQTVKKVTENPELKVAALKLAAQSVTAAQVIVTEQANTLQATLDALAKEVAAVTASQQAKTKTH